MIVFLIGFMGSGKTTTGKKLAERLGYRFLDTDREISGEFGMSVNEIFSVHGEKAFRQAEVKLLEWIVQEEGLVVSTGGGLPCQGQNMELMNRHGKTVYLRMTAGELFSRLHTRKNKRPLIRNLSDDELRIFIETRLAEREVYYNSAGIVLSGRNADMDELVRELDI